MPHALVLGTSRGLGLGLVRELAGRGWQVTGTVRRAADEAQVSAAGAAVARADITDAASLEALRAALARRGLAPLDLLFVNAGISEPDGLARIDDAGIGHLFLTNAVAPVRAAEILLPLVAPGGVIAFMSSRMGSVALTTADNKELYRASKAALNSLTRSFGSRHGAVHPVLSLHPGWVETDMGGKGADLDVATSVRGLADVVERRRGTPGSVFLDHAGTELPW